MAIRKLFSPKKSAPKEPLPPVEPTMLGAGEPVEEAEPPYMVEARLRMQDRLAAEKVRQNPPEVFTTGPKPSKRQKTGRRKENRHGNS